MIDVALTPEQLRASDVAVVIDVLRATSTATQALAAGYRRVLMADSVERAATLRAPGRVLAGERRCVTPDGFDAGNSPCTVRHRQGDELVLATTNGTPAAVAAARHAAEALLACLLNLHAVSEALRRAPAGDVHLVCAGTDGAVALEDVYVAGRLCAQLEGERTDAARAAEAVARAYRNPSYALAASADAAMLSAVGLGADIADCARVSTIEIVPRIVGVSAGVAVAEPAPARRPLVDAGDTVTV